MGLKDSLLDVLNIMGKGNISTLPLDDIMELCRNYFRKRTFAQKVKPKKHSDNIFSELIYELANFKIDILVELSILKGSKNNSYKAKES